MLHYYEEYLHPIQNYIIVIKTYFVEYYFLAFLGFDKSNSYINTDPLTFIISPEGRVWVRGRAWR